MFPVKSLVHLFLMLNASVDSITRTITPGHLLRLLRMPRQHRYLHSIPNYYFYSAVNILQLHCVPIPFSTIRKTRNTQAENQESVVRRFSIFSFEFQLIKIQSTSPSGGGHPFIRLEFWTLNISPRLTESYSLTHYTHPKRTVPRSFSTGTAI